ncbi:MAG: hypothetical protein AMXMBFR56_66250 [Polyangiaceae bacterium]
MRFERLTLKGMGTFPGEVTFDFAGQPGRLVAICGPNGAGKSTTLELILGALFRRTPTRGSLANLATGRDSYVELVVSNGARYTVRQSIDAINGKGEALITNGDGSPVLATSKVRDADAWIAKHFPSEEVIALTVFSHQGSGGFAALGRAERMSVIGRVVADIEGLEARANQARECARGWQGEVATLEARIADEKKRINWAPDVVEGYERLHGQAVSDAADAHHALEAARSAVRVAQAEAVRVAELRAAYEARNAELVRQARRAAELQAQGTDLERRIQNNRAVLEHAAEIRAAAAELEPTRGALTVAEREETEARSRATEAEGTLARLTEQRDAARATLARATARVEAAQRRFQDAGAVRAAAASLPGLRAALTAAREAVTHREEAVAAIGAERIAGADQRVDVLRTGLTTIAHGTPAPMKLAEETLAADDAALVAAESWTGRLAEANCALQDARVSLRAIERDVESTAALAARAADVEAASADIEAGREEVRAESEKRDAYEARRAAADRELQDLYAAIRDAEGRTRLARERVEVLAKTAAREGPLAGAEARLAELEPQLAAVRAELAALDSATPAPALPPSAPDVAALERGVTAAEATVRERDGLVAQWAQRAADARASAARVAALEADLASAHAELADWKRLADDLGRDGLQALEIDAGGPELSAIASDLLHAAYGSRWTVSLDTTRSDSKGKRLIEDCEINVIDTARGREGPLESFSGGERVILGEAVSLALTTIACRNAGIENPTLVRDESGAALDEAAGRAYVAMLRRAADLIGADRVLFVSHSPAMQELADARIEIGGAS